MKTVVLSALAFLVFAPHAQARPASQAADCAVLMAAELEYWDRSATKYALNQTMVSAYSDYIEAFSALAVKKGMSKQDLDAYSAQRFEKYVTIVYESLNVTTYQRKPYERIMSRCAQMSKSNSIPPIDY
mmetsp:Transcript_18273/g.29038  ORF Transcript_18273/g.29038 Transcript_18273/m.29038 type:complete len:129 (+) Transcript_18273:500-886(+)